MTDDPLADLLPAIQRLLPGSERVAEDAPDTAFGGPGAYLLLLHLADPVRFARHGRAASLAGWFVYAGSARGGGGVRARLGRHFRRSKPVHWHVDELTVAADRMAALVLPHGSECDIVDRLLRSGRFEPAFPRFGSSDCRRCPAHLLKPMAGPDARQAGA
ncbi:GIY-YIG nuclease family protein [Pleomorphomonas koreensis]|uniref:GIY-YIG nuclease family protein n=1 Tax=Pleomorphomonas koreensis TaxID=257440 RepID=UPI0003FBEA8B|nr:GIY-YIG nuclease family protein [Pleomorphomonas koreensis]